MVPLISISQVSVSVTIAEYDASYYHFLRTGDDSAQPLLRLTEYGQYKLSDHKRFIKLSRMIVALVLFLEEAGQHSYPT